MCCVDNECVEEESECVQYLWWHVITVPTFNGRWCESAVVQLSTSSYFVSLEITEIYLSLDGADENLWVERKKNHYLENVGLLLPPTSVQAEQAYSAAELLWQNWSRLNDNTVDTVCFLWSYYKLNTNWTYLNICIYIRLLQLRQNAQLYNLSRRTATIYTYG